VPHTTWRFGLYGVAGAAISVCVGFIAHSSLSHGSESTPFGIGIPPNYRDWPVISVAHEAGTLNDIRAILGNEVAVKSYRAGVLPFPDGTIIARVAWKYVPSADNNRAFGREQSFVAGAPTDWYLQLMVKDSKRYAASNGWGFAQFDKDGKPTDAARLQTCLPCHVPAKTNDFVFTHYAP
jgi:Cytochrome P460